MTFKSASLSMVLILFAAVPRADAAPFTLSDVNTIFSVEPTTQQGAFSWQVDGTEHLFQEWFWWRAFPGTNCTPSVPGPSFPCERSIDRRSNGTSALVSAVASNNDLDLGNDRLVITYSHPAQAFTLEVEYNLIGGALGSGVSTVSEKVSVKNTRALGGLNTTFNLFEYSDFNVNNTPDDDVATLTSASQITQTDPMVPGSAVVSVIQPAPDHYEIAPVTTIRDKLNNLSSTTLNDTGSPTGPTNVAFAFQWTEIITPQSTWIVQKEKSIAGLMSPVPEPGSLVLVGSGLLGLREWRRRRRSGRKAQN